VDMGERSHAMVEAFGRLYGGDDNGE